MFLTWGLLAMSLIDTEHQLLPDVLVLPLLWLGLIVNSFELFVRRCTMRCGARWPVTWRCGRCSGCSS
jgi:prepilin signal peptidase PulO-like enzyme (type II secretory pathway)